MSDAHAVHALTTLLDQVAVCRDPRTALPLLELLHASVAGGIWLSLPPVDQGAFFPITDHERLGQWLRCNERPTPVLRDDALPLRLEQRIIGLVRRPPQSADDSVIAMLAERLGYVLCRWSRTVQESRASIEKATLVSLCRAANAHNDLQRVLAEAYAALRHSLPFDAFVATVYDPVADMNVLSYSVAAGEVFVDNLVGPVPNSLQGYIVRHRCALHFNDLYNEIERYQGIQIVHFGGDTRMRSWIGVPMVLGDGRAVGMLSVQHAIAGLYSEHDLHFLEQVAVPVAIAIEKAMLLQQRDREIAVLTAQTELSEALGRAHDVRTALEVALTALEKSFPDQVYVLYAIDREGTIVAALCKENGQLYRDLGVGAAIQGHGLSYYILCQPGPVRFNSGQELEAAGVVWGQAGDITQPITEAVIGAALHASDGSPLGLISVQSYQRNAFDQRDAALLASIARQIALVVENARLIEQDQQRLRELEQANRELDLAQHRVIEAERRRAISDIAAGVAHDFNNLLGAILGNAQLIRLAETLEEAQALAEMIEVAARDAATIVRRIQEFTRSRDTLERTAVSVEALIESAINMTRPRWRDEAQFLGVAITIQREIQPVEAVLGIEAELREVLINLILNAIDAMPEGGTLTIGCRQVGDVVSIWVRDTGIGMSPEVLAHIGQPFFTTKGSRGSGLGLAVSQGIVQRHGGELTFHSVEGQGTTATIALPVARQSEIISAIEQVEQRYAGTILVVEDDTLLRQVLRRTLERAGHRVFDAATGSEALRLLERQPVDVLITDLGLPGMSGWDVARAARQLLPEVRVLLTTGWGERLAAEDAQRSGVMEILPKPLEQRTLLDAVQRAMRARRWPNSYVARSTPR